MAVTALSGQRWQGTSSPNCATFNGSNAVITGLGDLISGTGAYSISVWLYHTGGTSGNDGVCSSDGSQEILFYQGSTTKMYATAGGSSGAILASTTMSESTWYHVCLTRDDSGNCKLYMNAGTPATATSSGSITSGTWRFGYAHTTEFWGGSAIEFATWNGRELSATEVSAIYNSGNPKRLSDTTLDDTGSSYTEDLTGYYPMDTNFDKFAGTGGNNGSNANATVDNSSPATPIPADKDSVTDVPVGSEFEQTDDYKNYQWGGFLDGFGSSADATKGSAITLDETNTPIFEKNSLDNSGASGTSEAIYTDGSDYLIPLGTADCSISFWLRPESVSGTQAIIRDQESSGNAQLECRMDSASIGAYDDTSLTAIATLTVNKWHHIAMRRTGNKDYWYVDGVVGSSWSSGRDSNSISSGANEMHIIGRTTDSEHYTGQVCDVCFWNIVISTGNITSIFNSFDQDSATASDNTGLVATTVEPESIVAYYSCNSETVTNGASGWVERGTAL